MCRPAWWDSVRWSVCWKGLSILGKSGLSMDNDLLLHVVRDSLSLPFFSCVSVWSSIVSPDIVYATTVWLLSTINSCSSSGEDDSDNEAIKGEGFSENHHEDDGDHDISLGISTDTSVSNNSNTESWCKSWESTTEAWGEVLVGVEVVDIPSAGVFELFVCVGDSRGDCKIGS